MSTYPKWKLNLEQAICIFGIICDDLSLNMTGHRDGNSKYYSRKVRRLVKNNLVILAAIISIFTLIGCGGGNNESSKATATISTGPTATIPTPTQVASATQIAKTPESSDPGLSIFTKATYAPFELENIKYGGTFKIASDAAGIPNLDPKLSASVGGWIGTSQWWYDKLVTWEADATGDLMHLEPRLAEKWEISSDYKTYTFTLRKGIRFHNIAPVNGRELVADDVVFSLNRYLNNPQATPLFAQVDSISSPDKSHIVIKVKDPTAWLINDLFGKGEVIVAPELVQETAGTLSTKAIGTGPYILKTWGSRVGSESLKNPDYWRKDTKGNTLPYVDSVINTFITDGATIVAGFRTGQIDQGGIRVPEDIMNLSKSVPGARVFRTTVGTPPSTTPAGIAFNTKKAPWNDVRVRRALALATDYTKYFETVSSLPSWDYGSPLPWSFVSKEAFTPDMLGPYYKFNPTEAKKLLIEAGYPDGKLKIENPITYTTRRSPNAAVLQQLYKTYGIDLPIQLIDDATFGSQYYQRIHKDLAFTFQNTGDLSLNWYAQNRYLDDGLQNTSFIADPEIQKIVQKIKFATDPAELQQYAKILWDFDTQGVWNIWLPLVPAYDIQSARLRNYTQRRGGNFSGQLLMPWLADAPRTNP